MRLDASAPSKWSTEERFPRYADRAFEYWGRNLLHDPAAAAVNDAGLYADRVKSTLEREAEAAGTAEDEAANPLQKLDWESRKETYPHRPPEADVWKFIEKQPRP